MFVNKILNYLNISRIFKNIRCNSNNVSFDFSYSEHLLNNTKIVVIDDLREAGEAIRDIPDSLFIWTDYNTGLTKEEADKAIEFLNKGE